MVNFMLLLVRLIHFMNLSDWISIYTLFIDLFAKIENWNKKRPVMVERGV